MVNFYMNRTLPMNGWYGKIKKNQIESILAEKCKLNIDFFSTHIFKKDEFGIVIAVTPIILMKIRSLTNSSDV